MISETGIAEGSRGDGVLTMVQSIFYSWNCCYDTLFFVCNRVRNGFDWKFTPLTAGLVIAPSFMGTLKSTRMRTRLPLRSRSVMASLLDNDMVISKFSGWA